MKTYIATALETIAMCATLTAAWMALDSFTAPDSVIGLLLLCVAGELAVAYVAARGARWALED